MPQNLPLWLLVLVGAALLVVTAVAVALWGPLRGPESAPPPPSSLPEAGAPTIVGIEFPKEIPADGEAVVGKVRFRDPDGDVVRVEFEVVEALVFTPFAFDPGVQGRTEGEFEFSIFTVVPQEVVLRAVLVDAQGHRSVPVELRFTATPAMEDFSSEPESHKPQVTSSSRVRPGGVMTPG